MRKLLTIAAWFLSALLTSANVQAQDIQVLVNGNAISPTPFPSGSAITIPVGSIIGDTLVIISDVNPGPTGVRNGVGQLTFDGTLGASTGRLSILIARNASEFPQTPRDLLAPGLTGLGTSTSAGFVFTDPTLRDHSRLAVAITGDIHGVIDVGQVFVIHGGWPGLSPR